jgi:hypothetical protein
MSPVPSHTRKTKAVDGRTTRQTGYAVSQIIRKQIEESFAWTKTTAGLHKPNTGVLVASPFQFTFQWQPTI